MTCAGRGKTGEDGAVKPPDELLSSERESHQLQLHAQLDLTTSLGGLAPLSSSGGCKVHL